MIKETKFTPGHWRRGFKNIGHVTAENGAIVAKCQRLTSLCNMQANAHLIAAAPELYESLNELAAILNGVCPIYVQEALERAHAALTKARGEKS